MQPHLDNDSAEHAFSQESRKEMDYAKAYRFPCRFIGYNSENV